MKVKFSVITVCLNAEKEITQTIQSVLNQNYCDYEMIIKDGGSKDNTLSVIPNNEHIHVISQIDSCLYDAMNQAVRYSNGEYLMFMNAGDVFYDNDVLMKLATCIEKEYGDIYYGEYSRDGIVVKQPAILSNFSIFRNPLNHQSVCFRRDVLQVTDWYDTSYKILADYELMVRLFIDGKKFIHVPIVIDQYEGNGVSESEEGAKRNRQEMEIVRKKYFPNQYLKYKLILLFSFVKVRSWLVKDSTPKWLRQSYRTVSNYINGKLR